LLLTSSELLIMDVPIVFSFLYLAVSKTAWLLFVVCYDVSG